MTNNYPYRNPRKAYILFDLQRFLQTAGLNPLSAKANLVDAVEKGYVTFPHGTTEQRFYASFFKDVWTDKYPVNPDREACRARYGKPLDEEPCFITAFPYQFVLELLDRLSTGEHPWFWSWATGMLGNLFFNDPELSEPGEELVRYKFSKPQ